MTGDIDEGRLAEALTRRLCETAGSSSPDWAERLGPWHQVADGNWVGGFSVAPLWLRAGSDPVAADMARTALAGLTPLLDRPTSFNGFVFHYAAGFGATLAQDERAQAAAVRAAHVLTSGAHPRTGVIPLGEPDLPQLDPTSS